MPAPFRVRFMPALLALLFVAGCSRAAEVVDVRAPSTSPLPPVFVAVKGDWGYGSSEQTAITQRMCDVRKQRPFADVITTGDNFYRPDGEATERNFGAPEACLIAVPEHMWRPSWGNHDFGRKATAETLGAKDHYYSWRTGKATFIALDSNMLDDASQTAFLEKALSASSDRIKIVYFHHPAFTGGPHVGSEEVRTRWVPLFERYGVDLVLNGHNHSYEHSVVNSIHYVVTGGGGAVTYPCLRQEPYLIKCEPEHHFLVLRLEVGRAEVTALRVDGSVLDSFWVSET